LRNVGWADLGARKPDVGGTLDRLPTFTIAVFQLPGSNALDTAAGI
jgi:multidrug efflux pump